MTLKFLWSNIKLFQILQCVVAILEYHALDIIVNYMVGRLVCPNFRTVCSVKYSWCSRIYVVLDS